MTKTAVEWLEDKYKKLHIPTPKALFDHAKEMEKEQIIQAFCCGGDGESGAEIYYNEMFSND